MAKPGGGHIKGCTVIDSTLKEMNNKSMQCLLEKKNKGNKNF
jgi:hypothetical protein